MRFHIMPFHFFGGQVKNCPSLFETLCTRYTQNHNNFSKTYPLTRVQTDGFFYPRRKEGTVGAVLNFPEERQQGCTYPIYHIESVMEAKWAAIYFGLEMAKRCDQEFVGIETDSLTIVRQIMMDDRGEQTYARYYHHKIKEIGNELQWCGIRHVPSDLIQVHKMLE